MKGYMLAAVRCAIANLPPHVVGIGEDCLWQLTARHIKNGPQGTNAAWVARQDFNIVVSDPAFRKFVYREAPHA